MDFDQIDAAAADMRQFIAEAHAGRARYLYVMPTLLEVGVHAFIPEVKKARDFADRVLELLEKTRQYKAVAESMRDNLRDYLDELIVHTLSQTDVEVPKKLSTAEQRTTWARMEHRADAERAAAWKRIHAELKSLEETLESHEKVLVQARGDLRGQLLAIKIHAYLGDVQGVQVADLIQDMRDLEHEMHPYTALPPDAKVERVLPPPAGQIAVLPSVHSGAEPATEAGLSLAELVEKLKRNQPK